MTSYILGIVTAVLILAVVIEMLRRGRLRERHAVWWIIAGALALVIGIFPSTLVWLSELLNVAVPSNLIFFVCIAILFLVCIQTSSELTDLENKTRTLSEEAALLRLRIESLEEAAESGASPTVENNS